MQQAIPSQGTKISRAMQHITKQNIAKQKTESKYYFCLWLFLKQVKTYKHGAVKL